MKSNLPLLFILIALPIAFYSFGHATVRGYTSSSYVNTQSVAVSPGTYGSLQVPCTYGDYATGGGFDSAVTTGGTTSLEVMTSRPSGGSAPPTVWSVRVYNPTAGSLTLYAYVVCQTPITSGSVTSSSYFKVASVVVASGTIGDVAAYCSAGDYATGGGFGSDVTGLEPVFSRPYGTPSYWDAVAYNPTAGSLTLYAYVVCQTPITSGSVTSSSYFKMASEVVSSGTFSTIPFIISCSAGDYAIGGGFSGSANTPPLVIIWSIPDGSAPPTGWSANAYNPNPGSLTLYAYVVCQTPISAKASTSIGTILSATTITVGGSVTDSATLTTPTSGAGGTVQYEYFSGGICGGAPSNVGAAVIVSNGIVPNSMTQTFNTAGSYSWNAVYSGDTNHDAATSPCEHLTVNPFSPSSATTLSATTITVGGSVSDSATLTGATSTAGGTVQYEYFSGGVCGGAPTYVGSPATVTNGVVPNSISQPFNTAGTFSWNAIYSGDTNNNGATSPCESLTVQKASPTLVTSISASTIVVGNSATDSATLTGGFPSAGVTGTVTYSFFSNGLCTGPASGTQPVTVGGGNSVPTSSAITPTISGSYSFQVSYSGDSNNNPATSPCESMTVSKATPTITITLATTAMSAGGSTHASATLRGATSTAGGTVTYLFYSDNTCGGTGTTTVSTVTVANGVVPDSIVQTFNTAGTYSWNAIYHGDSNNNPVTSSCLVLVVSSTSTGGQVSSLPPLLPWLILGGIIAGLGVAVYFTRIRKTPSKG